MDKTETMALTPPLSNRLRLPVIGSPLFIISNPDLVIAQWIFSGAERPAGVDAGRVAASHHRGTGRLGSCEP
jgi:hypothetical protein